ncbi:MAG: DNA polymerase IV [Campylobacterota bacterium]|nr:DNA polymerase IV [Campylobacterota bacterium]
MKIHIDLDAFFVAAERTEEPSLCHKPVGIGGRGDQSIFASQSGHQSLNLENSGAFVGTFFQTYHAQSDDMQRFIDPDGRVRGILTTSSYEARAFGIHTGMSIREALQRCPELIVKAPNMQLYQRLSRQLHTFLQHRIPLIEQASIDEFYGDLSGWVADDDLPCFIDMLRHEIKRSLDLPVSIGAAQTKFIAKLATGQAKPFGCRTITSQNFASFIEAIPVKEFPGIGRSMQHRLKEYRIGTLGELIRSRSLVESWGPYAKELYRRVSAMDHTEVTPDQVRKSIGISRTFDPERERAEMRRRIIILARHLAYAIMRIGVIPTTFHVGIRYELRQHSHANITQNRLFNEKWFKDLVLSLFYKADRYRTLQIIRLSISCSHFTSNSRRELSLIDFEKDSVQRHLSMRTQKVRDKYGLDILRWGSEMEI